MKKAWSAAIILLLSLLCLESSWAAPVGRVILAVGEVSALRQGRSVPLNLGAEVESGDRIRTGQASNAQIRFVDSAIVALRPDSDFGIDQYVFDGQQDGSERALFSLLKGGMRTISGLIGKLNQRNYAVRTPTATIGIRGTHFNIVHCDNDCKNGDGSNASNGTYGGVSDGRIAVTPLNAAAPPVASATPVAGRQYAAATRTYDVAAIADTEPLILAQAGGGGGGGGGGAAERIFGAGEFFRVPDANTPATQILAPPPFLTDKLEGQLRARQSGTANPSASASPTTASGGNAVDARATQTIALANVVAPTQVVAAPTLYVSTEATTSSGSSSVLPIGKVTGFIAEYSNGISFRVIEDCPDVSCGGPALQATSFSFNGNNLSSYSGSGFSGSFSGSNFTDTGTVTIGGVIFGWGRANGPFTVTDSNGTFTDAIVKSGVLVGYTNDPKINTAASNPNLPTSGSFSYSLVGGGGPSPVDTNGNVGTMSSMTGTFNAVSRAVGLSFSSQFSIPSQGNASFSMSGGGTISPTADHLSSASLSGSCTGSACISPSASGAFDARFLSNGQGMVVNGGVTNALKDTATGSGTPRSFLFLDVLKCTSGPGC